MNDQILMENYLLVLKSTIEVYVHGTLESSNPDVRNILNSCLEETIDHQARTYDEMTNYGWYKIKNVKPNIIENTLNNIKGK